MAVKHKKEMVARLQDILGLKNRLQARVVFDAVIDVIKEQIDKYNECWIKGFGKFHIIERKAREIWNPHAKKKIIQPMTRVLKFKPAREYKRELNR